MRTGKHPLNSDGVWCEILTLGAPRRPALFLDRDGAVVEETDYLCRVEDIVMIPEQRRRLPPPTNAASPWSWSRIRPELAAAITAGPNFKSCNKRLSHPWLPQARESTPFMPVRITRKVKARTPIPIIRRGSLIPGCCCKPRRTSRSTSSSPGSLATRRLTWTPRSAPALPAPCKSRRATGTPNATSRPAFAGHRFRRPVWPIDCGCDKASTILAAKCRLIRNR